MRMRVRESTRQQGIFFSTTGERGSTREVWVWAPACSPANFRLGSGVYGLGCTCRQREGKNEGRDFVDDERKRFNLVF
jgi:hypothetical protein